MIFHISYGSFDFTMIIFLRKNYKGFNRTNLRRMAMTETIETETTESDVNLPLLYATTAVLSVYVGVKVTGWIQMYRFNREVKKLTKERL